MELECVNFTSCIEPGPKCKIRALIALPACGLKTLSFSRSTYCCVCQKRYSFLFHVSLSSSRSPLQPSHGFSFQFPSSKHSLRTWQSCQLSTNCHLPSLHPRPQPPLPPTFPELSANSRLGGWQDLLLARLETPTQFPPTPLRNTQMDPRRRNPTVGGTAHCSLILETVARWRFPPRSRGFKEKKKKKTCGVEGLVFPRGTLLRPF